MKWEVLFFVILSKRYITCGLKMSNQKERRSISIVVERAFISPTIVWREKISYD